MARGTSLLRLRAKVPARARRGLTEPKPCARANASAIDNRSEAEGSVSVRRRDRRYGFGQTITVGPFGARGVPTVSSVTLTAMTEPDSIMGDGSVGTSLVPSVRSSQSASPRKAL